MKKVPFAEVALTLLTSNEGGRKRPLDLNKPIRPHIVIGNISQRVAVFSEDNRIEEEYIGVQFRPCDQMLYPGETATIVLDLMYYPNISYEKVKQAETFTLRDGPKIIGFGHIISVTIE